MSMTNHPYQHPTTGPSYYPVYGNHSPVPRPIFYPYPPPHMPPHPSPQYQHPTPSRGSHRGGHVNGSYTSRGSQPYHHTYHPQPQVPPYHHPSSLSPPVNGLPLSQHPGQQIPYSPQSAKYDSSYPPSCHYPSPNAPVFTPSWQTQSPGHLLTTTKPVAQWAIWSRRPQDPSQAPSIIISPRARPPPDVVQRALDLTTPPPSPPVSPSPVQSPITPSFDDTLKLPSDRPENVCSFQSDSTVPSSSATEAEETSTVPGSPVSSHTSVSVIGTPAKDPSDVQPLLTEAEASPITTSATTPSVVNAASTSSSSDTTVLPIETPEAGTPEPPPTSSIDAVSSPQIQQPIVADTQPVPPAPKKSWASLLRNSASPGNSLPTSSVVGFSIPGTGQVPHLPVPLSRKSELLNLLTSFPPATTGVSTAATGSPSIRPRGLVNNGNMCFANSVLQVLVYCPPFHRLFVELGRLLGSDGANSKDNLTSNNNNNKTLAASSTLINATALFMQEFLEVSEKKTKADSISRTGVNNSSGSGVKGSGKGKEKEFKEEKSVGDNWDESFLPSYVYDVMKTKKRFDTMRGGHQEDAEEFFGFYLDTLEEELLSIIQSINPPRQRKASTTSVEEKEAAPPEDDGWFEVGKRNRSLVTRTIKSAESPITRIFGGKVRSTLRASGQKDSVVVEDWRSLRLDIQRDQIHTIQGALSYISHPEVVQVTHSAKPGIIVDAHQQVLIEALPPILVLHIKRFYYDTTVGGVVKVGKHIRYGPELEFPSDLMAPTARKAPIVRYKLFGALYHHGQSASGGHYTLDVLHPTRFSSGLPHAKPREGWVRIDDELVSDVRLDDVFKSPEEDDTRCAYLLFYRRI